jgi:predicted nuclease of predicted toxin-antitoxin system
VRILADTNIVAQAVRALREMRHDVTYAAERPSDPGDVVLLAEAVSERHVFISKDRDIGPLVHRDLQPHCGVLLIDDLGNAEAEAALIVAAFNSHGERLAEGAFIRAGQHGIREPG